MSDARLIDANAADVERICCYYGGNCYIEDVKEWLDEQPTIDAVSVVRCRECKWCELLPISAYCAMWDSITKRNGFCYRGAKMDAKEG